MQIITHVRPGKKKTATHRGRPRGATRSHPFIPTIGHVTYGAQSVYWVTKLKLCGWKQKRDQHQFEIYFHQCLDQNKSIFLFIYSCFLKPGNAFYFGQILIIGFVLLFNFIIFTLVMRRLTCARKGLSSTSDRGNRDETLRRLQNAVIISVLLGLTWVFGLLSLIETANFVFQILFCIFNSLQGLMIFILFCLRQQEIRKAWKAFFKCGDDRQAKYSNTAGATSRGNTDTKTKSTIPLTNQSTNSTS